MKSINPIVLFIIVLAFAVFGHSQSTMSGKVVDVLDGKTVVIEIPTGRLTAALQYIEVPEPEQPLHQTVRDHLAKLVLDKDVVFRASGLDWRKTFGQLYVGSVDVSLQMLRDGAAWHINGEKSGQNAADSDAYEYHQNQAKQEQRGVWGVKDLKPAWQFRAEKIDRARQEQTASENAALNERAAAKIESSSAKKPEVRKAGMWTDRNPWLPNPGPLMHGYNAASKTGYVGTSLLGIKELESMPKDQKTAVDITYVYKQEDEKTRKGVFVITLISEADDWRFLKSNNATVMVDEKSTFVGKPKRTAFTENGKSIEKLTYEVNKATIEKIVYGGDVVIKIGDYSLFPGAGMQLFLYNMLLVAG